MEFSIVILSKHIDDYPKITWTDWKDDEQKKNEKRRRSLVNGNLIWCRYLGLPRQQQD